MSTEQNLDQMGSEATMSEEENILNDDTKCSIMKTDEVSGEAAKNQAKLNLHFTEDSLEAMGTLQAEKVDEIISQWEGAFFKDNPRLKKKSMSLRFEIYLEGQDDNSSPNKNDYKPNIEVKMILRHQGSSPTINT